MISNENKELNEKLYDKTDDLNRLKREYNVEKMMQVMRERQKVKGIVYQRGKNRKYDDRFYMGNWKKMRFKDKMEELYSLKV